MGIHLTQVTSWWRITRATNSNSSLALRARRLAATICSPCAGQRVSAVCGHERAWPVRKVWFECARCGRQTSVTAGTIFQDTRKPLRLWFRAMWTITTQKNGASALGLQRVLGLGSYQTAWPWMHKLRRAMVRPGRERLTGLVEVDETYWGAEEEGVIGRQTERKALIAVAAEERGTGLPHAGSGLGGQFDASRSRSSRAASDNWSGYDPLKKKDYQRRIMSPRAGLAATAVGALGDRATQALDAGHHLADLSRRVRVPLQSAQITQSLFYRCSRPWRWSRRRTAPCRLGR